MCPKELKFSTDKFLKAENVTLCVTKELLMQIVYINFLLRTNIFVKSIRRGVHWTPMQTPGLHINNPTVCVSRLRACLAICLHQISVTNPWKSNTTKNRKEYLCGLQWWTFTDSNCGPSGYEPDALTNWAKGPLNIAKSLYNKAIFLSTLFYCQSL